MKRILFLSICLIVTATMSFAQSPGGTIRVYADDQGTDCNFSDQAPGLVSYYLFHENSPGASAVEFQLDLAGFEYSSWFGDSSPFGLKIGNFLEGVSISYEGCLFGTVYLGVARFMGTGTTNECHYVFVKNHPFPSISGATTPVSVDCFGTGQLMLVDGGAGIINPNEDCHCPEIFENCPAADSGALLFAERYSTDAGYILDPPGVPYTYITKFFEITRLPNEIIYLSGSPDSWSPLVADDDILINRQSVGPGPYTVLDPAYPIGVPVELILQPMQADEIPVSLISHGTSCVKIDLVDTQRSIYGNTNIYLFKAAGEATYLTISCPDSISVSCIEEVPPPDISTVTVTSSCPGAIAVIHIDDVSDGQQCPEIVTRTYHAVDNCGNQEHCSQKIAVIDMGTPVITSGPADIGVQCSADIPAADVGLITAVGNCAGGVTITHEGDTPPTGTCGGYVDRTYRATNTCGNYDEYVQRITINDTTPPVLSNCPDDTVIECEEDVPAANVTTTDNCGGAITPTCETIREAPDRIRRTWTAVDPCGNAASCTQLITIDDTTPPVLHGCPGNLTLNCGSVMPDPANVTATDNCDRPLASFTFEQTETNPDADCENTITRTWTAIDSSGNSKSCYQTISLVIPPVCSVYPKVLDFGDVWPGSSKDLSFVIYNIGTEALTGYVGEECAPFSILSGGGAYTLEPSEFRVVEVRFAPTHSGPKTCTISTSSECDDVFARGGIVTVGVTVQSHSIVWREDHVELSWRVQEVAGKLSFDITRKSNDGELCLLTNPEIVQNGEEFILHDRTAVPGETYTYHVAVKEDGIAATSFETTITIPALTFALHQAHPNPFKDATLIGFTLESAEHVSLDVYDIAGKHVCTLVDRSLGAGEHSETWNGKDNNGKRVASGIYFYRLKAGKQALVRKMVLLK